MSTNVFGIPEIARHEVNSLWEKEISWTKRTLIIENLNCEIAMRTLICVTHYNRFSFLRQFVPPYVDFCYRSPDYDFLVGLDGANKEIIDFCVLNGIPLLYSELPEGVGMVKNKVIKLFSNYDFLFFIDDDVELVDDRVFSSILNLSMKHNIHHLSLGEDFRFFGNRREINLGNESVAFSDYGSGAFNFFTTEGLRIVGGFHDHFVKYKRYGHTEHSTRFATSGLSPSAFVFPVDLEDCFIWHNPVSHKPNLPANENNISVVELEIIKQKLTSYPILFQQEPILYGFPPKTNLPWLPLRNRYLSPFLSFSERRAVLSNQSIASVGRNYRKKNRLMSVIYLLKYLLFSFPKIKFKTASLLVFFFPFINEKRILKELDQIEFE